MEMFNKMNNKNISLTAEELLVAPRSHIFEVRLKQSQVLRIAGNDCFEEGDFSTATKLYERALYHANFDNANMGFQLQLEQEAEIYSTIIPVHLNLSRCATKRQEYTSALSLVQKGFAVKDWELVSLDLKLKLHHVRGRCYMAVDDTSMARQDFEAVLKLIESIDDKATHGAQDGTIVEGTEFSAEPVIRDKFKSLRENVQNCLLELERKMKTDKLSEKKAWKGRLLQANNNSSNSNISNISNSNSNRKISTSDTVSSSNNKKSYSNGFINTMIVILVLLVGLIVGLTYYE